MNDVTLPMAVWLTVTYATTRRRGAALVGRLTDRLVDDAGADESITKLIWVAIAVALTVGATAIVVTTFRNAPPKIPTIPVPTT
jgi:hypothetical protein